MSDITIIILIGIFVLIIIFAAIFLPVFIIKKAADKENAQKAADASARAKEQKIANAPQQLLKYKQLLAQGVITEEEFEAKKRELL